uniref:cAMP-responsive element-binding protein-like 2 n=1 Tax=Oreochromis aureus TaxID=47969 RepID=A0AAZ1XDL4_OREAU
MEDNKMAGKVKKPGKRGRKPAKIDLKAKLERSRQSARECRARKKLRYQYLEELVSSKERAICALREELEMVRHQLDMNSDFKHMIELCVREKLHNADHRGQTHSQFKHTSLSALRFLVFK